MIVSGYPWAVRACLNQTISGEGSFFDYVVVYVTMAHHLIIQTSAWFDVWVADSPSQFMCDRS